VNFFSSIFLHVLIEPVEFYKTVYIRKFLDPFFCDKNIKKRIIFIYKSNYSIFLIDSTFLVIFFARRVRVRLLSYAQQLFDHITCEHYETYIIRCSFSRCIQYTYFQTSLAMKITRKIEFMEKSCGFLQYKKTHVFRIFLSHKKSENF